MPDHVIDVDEDAFQTEVVERSHDQPVVVDFWAEWCEPCRSLGPVLEDAVAARDGAVRLARVDVDAHGPLAARHNIRGIPAVKGFRDGQIVAQFTGAQPRDRIDEFLDALVPTDADRMTAEGDELAGSDADAAARSYRRALELDPGHRGAAVGLARLLVEEDPGRARELVGPHLPDSGAEAVAARADLVLAGVGDLDELRSRVEDEPDDGGTRLLLGRTLAAEGQHREAVEHLLAAVELGGDPREEAREHLVSLFTALGDHHPLVREQRPRLARALY